MKLRLLPIVLTAALSLPMAAANPPKPATTPSADEARSSTRLHAADETRRPLLWAVSDADNTVYLLGSFHLLKPDDYPLPAEIDRAFDDAESLLFEIDPREMTAPETMLTVRKYMAYEDGKSLSTALPKSTLDKLGKAVAARGGSLQAMEQSKPWAISLGLVLGMTQALGFKAELGLDQHLMARAAKAGKPAQGLETIDDQMRAMDAVPHAEQARGLDEFLSDPAEAATQLQELHRWWRAGDVTRLDNLMRVEMAEKSPESYKLLDVDRNKAWLPLLEQRLTGSTTDDSLVVVGALHLLGTDGLVEQLRAKGYQVQHVCDSCKSQASPHAH